MSEGLTSEYFERLSRSEAEYAKRLRDLASRLKHPVVRALVLSVALDSEKHSHLYRALAELARGSPALESGDLEELRRELGAHVEEERRDLEEVKRIIEERPDLDARVKLILELILEDEKRHHSLFKAVYERVARMETVSEQDFWESVWRDAMFHGTPGG